MGLVEQRRMMIRSGWSAEPRSASDQARGLPQPPPQKPIPEGAKIVSLPAVDRQVIAKADIHDCLASRASRREFGDEALSLGTLSYLLWATQGLRSPGVPNRRIVPSAGARHPFETYLAVNRAETLDAGIYQYLPLSRELALLELAHDLPRRLTDATLGQAFVGQAAVVFCWTCVPYRTEWRYHAEAAKLVLLDAGHVCQNLYLAAEACGCGTCAVAAYDQAAVDALLGLDGRDEFCVYLAPVGRAR